MESRRVDGVSGEAVPEEPESTKVEAKPAEPAVAAPVAPARAATPAPAAPTGSAWEVASAIVGLDASACPAAPEPAERPDSAAPRILGVAASLRSLVYRAWSHPAIRTVPSRTSAAWEHPLRNLAVGTLLAALILVAAFALHWMAQMDDVFGQMGFDPDRAQLVGALLLGGILAAASTIVSNRLGPAVVAGFAGAVALFAATFIAVSQRALASREEAGIFDLVGWLMTLAALIMAGLVAAWAGGALAVVARPAIAETIGLVRVSVAERRLPGRTARRLAAAAFVVVFLAGTAPVFSDLVNYTVDVHMVSGGPAPIGLGGQGLSPDRTFALTPDTASEPSDSATDTPAASARTSANASVTPSPAASDTPGPSGTPVNMTPWRAWMPSGVGTINSFILQPAPWKQGPNDYAEVTVMTPPGYNAKSTRRYPVLYEAPYAFSHWNEAINISSVFNSLMDRGLMPASIVVAMSTAGGAFTDSECADSFDGKEWFDTYVVNQVVPYIDSHYKTIPKANARATVGASQGGYCAPALASRHPDVFSAAIAFSGYFHAGRLGPPSTLPFGTDKDFIDAASPDVLVSRMSPDVRQSQYYILVAKLDQPVYGPETSRFAELLWAYDVPHVLLSSETPHGWRQMKLEFQRAMQAWGARMVLTGVFDTP